MIGRIVGVIVGAAIAVTGYGMQKPQTFARYFDFAKLPLGPFAEYKTIVCWMIVAVGVVVALAALQRPSGGRKKRVAPVMFAPAEPEPVHAEPAHAAPVPAADSHHDDHGHVEHHGEHGHAEPHDDHGHGAHHDDHGDDHGHGHGDHHGQHEPEVHAHEPAH
jgi:hypothetical protein